VTKALIYEFFGQMAAGLGEGVGGRLHTTGVTGM